MKLICALTAVKTAIRCIEEISPCMSAVDSTQFHSPLNILKDLLQLAIDKEKYGADV